MFCMNSCFTYDVGVVAVVCRCAVLRPNTRWCDDDQAIALKAQRTSRENLFNSNDEAGILEFLSFFSLTLSAVFLLFGFGFVFCHSS